VINLMLVAVCLSWWTKISLLKRKLGDCPSYFCQSKTSHCAGTRAYQEVLWFIKSPPFDTSWFMSLWMSRQGLSNFAKMSTSWEKWHGDYDHLPFDFVYDGLLMQKFSFFCCQFYQSCMSSGICVKLRKVSLLQDCRKILPVLLYFHFLLKSSTYL